LLTDLTKRYEVAFVINESSFKSEGQQTIMEAKPYGRHITKVEGFTLHRLLNYFLNHLPGGAAFLVRKEHIEIATATRVVTETSAHYTRGGNDNAPPEYLEPLVSAIYKDRPLNELVAELAEEYGPERPDVSTSWQ